MIKVRVKNRIITCKKELVEDNVDTFSLIFDFDSMWEGYTKRITFYNDSIEECSSNPIEIPLGDSCVVPWEVIQSPGNLYLSIKGTKQDTGEVILTQLMSNPIKVNIAGLSGGAVPAEPTPDMVTLILNTAQEAKDIAQSVRDDADAGKFIGPQGPQGAPGKDGERGPQGEPGTPGATDYSLLLNKPRQQLDLSTTSESEPLSINSTGCFDISKAGYITISGLQRPLNLKIGDILLSLKTNEDLKVTIISVNGCYWYDYVIPDKKLQGGQITTETDLIEALKIYIPKNAEKTLPTLNEYGALDDSGVKLDDLQTKLTAGNNITIDGDVISATGGSSDVIKELNLEADSIVYLSDFTTPGEYICKFSSIDSVAQLAASPNETANTVTLYNLLLIKIVIIADGTYIAYVFGDDPAMLIHTEEEDLKYTFAFNYEITQLNSLIDSTNRETKALIPTKNSQLTNDSNFITLPGVTDKLTYQKIYETTLTQEVTTVSKPFAGSGSFNHLFIKVEGVGSATNTAATATSLIVGYGSNCEIVAQISAGQSVYNLENTNNELYFTADVVGDYVCGKSFYKLSNGFYNLCTTGLVNFNSINYIQIAGVNTSKVLGVGTKITVWGATI